MLDNFDHNGIASSSLQLSSGFEDYFLSGQYFDAGEFASPLSGMTAEDKYLYPNSLTAYRIHEADPVVFNGSAVLRWQNGHPKSGDGAPGVTTLRSLVLTYEWT